MTLPAAVTPDLPDRPDPRFLLANERTFLAWLRTSLALLAAGVGVVNLASGFASGTTRHLLGAALVALGLLSAATAYWRWRSNDAAIRGGHPMASSRTMPVLAAGLTVVGVAAFLLVLFDSG